MYTGFQKRELAQQIRYGDRWRQFWKVNLKVCPISKIKRREIRIRGYKDVIRRVVEELRFYQKFIWATDEVEFYLRFSINIKRKN